MRGLNSILSKIHPSQSSLLSESCVLVTKSDSVIGSCSKQDCHRMNQAELPKLHRAFSLFLFNERHQLMLQQRSDLKITFPGVWTNTCCSHPLMLSNQQVEDARSAARRRVKDELGINDLDTQKALLVGKILYGAKGKDGWGEHELDHVLVMRSHQIDYAINEDEVKNVTFVGQEELEGFVRNKEISPWFKLICQSGLLNKWWSNLDQLERVADPHTIVDLGVDKA